MPIHAELLSNGSKSGFQFSQIKGQRTGTDAMAHKKTTTDRIGIMIGFYNPATMAREKLSDSGHNANPVRTRNG